MKPTQHQITETLKSRVDAHKLIPVADSLTLENTCPRATYLKPILEHLGALNQIVRGSSAKGVDCAGELDLATYPF